jgi:hypothetical protein
MRNYLLIFLLALFCLPVSGQKKAKPKLLVYGQGDAAFATAMQASASGVSTLWVLPDGALQAGFEQQDAISRLAVQSVGGKGIWTSFLLASQNSKTSDDSVLRRAASLLSPPLARTTSKAMIDSSRNLQVRYNSGIRKVKKSGKRWKVTLNDGSSHKVFAVVDAAKEPVVLPLIEASDRAGDTSRGSGLIAVDSLYASGRYKTSVGVLEDGRQRIVPSTSLIRPQARNIFTVYGDAAFSADFADRIRETLIIGQAFGATAAYCAFFETESDKIDIRTLQGELLAFKVELIPFSDIAFEDRHYQAIQRIGMTGILKGKVGGEKLVFDTDSHVSSGEMRPVIESLYTRSQIWFRDKSIDELKLADLLDLIKFIALKGDELNKEVERGWQSRFKFTGVYDPECLVSRRQVAVLLDQYLKPFEVTVQKDGSFRY